MSARRKSTRPAKRRAVAFSIGAASRQGTHYEAQKLSTTGRRPRESARRTVLPSWRARTVRAGAGLPSRLGDFFMAVTRPQLSAATSSAAATLAAIQAAFLDVITTKA